MFLHDFLFNLVCTPEMCFCVFYFVRSQSLLEWRRVGKEHMLWCVTVNSSCMRSLKGSPLSLVWWPARSLTSGEIDLISIPYKLIIIDKKKHASWYYPHCLWGFFLQRWGVFCKLCFSIRCDSRYPQRRSLHIQGMSAQNVNVIDA